MGPRGFWIALAIVLFYLIARPHVGTVWFIQTDRLEPIPRVNPGTSLGDMAPANPYNGGAVPIPSAPPSPAARAYAFNDECNSAAKRYESLVGFLGAYCSARTALLWGW